MYTRSIRKEDVKRNWYVIDAQDVVLGRLAVFLATKLRGKDKPFYTPHVDCGDHIIVINAHKVALTGNKREDKKYYWHTGYVGGIKERPLGKILDGKFPERVIMKAVERMIPKGPLGRDVILKLRVYGRDNHPHVAQNPTTLDFGKLNRKNKINLGG